MILTEKEQLEVVLNLINTKISLPKFKTEMLKGKPVNSIIGHYELSLIGERDLIQLRNVAMGLLTKLVPGVSIEELKQEEELNKKIETDNE